MTKQRFWVVGGDYTCMQFKSLRDGGSTIVGPFEDRDEAKAEWKKLSEKNRSKATSRYTIAAEEIRA
jgi:hypothetical protein